MNRELYLIGIDNGGTLSKAVLFDRSGKELAVSSRKTDTIMPHPGFVERDMEEMWQANLGSIRDVIRISGVNPEDVAGVATTGHGNGLYLVGEDGRPVCNGIISTDTRAGDYVKRWYADGTFDEVLPKTMQSIWAGQPVALLAWFRDHRPEVLRRARYVFLCKDYIRYRLTGEAFAEITDISGTNLMNVRDVRYDRDLLKKFGIEEVYEKLPPIRYSAELCGHITKEVAAETGLKEGTPVAGGLFDIDASAIASGITTDREISLTVGTWGINEYISSKPVVSKELFMTSLYCMKGYWLVTEGSATSASNLEWYVTQFMKEEKAACKKENRSVYQYADMLVENTRPEESSVIFLPFLFGTNVDTKAKACFLGVNGWHTQAHMLRALYEGVAFCHKMHVEKLLQHRQKPPVIRIAGGAAKSKIWVQIFSDVLQAPIEVTKSTELGALGAAMCAGIATGEFESFPSAADSMVKIAYTCYPDPGKQGIYSRKFQLYQEAIQSLSALWDKLSELE